MYSDVVQDVNHATHRVMENLARFSGDPLVFREQPCIRTDTDRIEIDSGVTVLEEHCWVDRLSYGSVCKKSEVGEWKVQERLPVPFLFLPRSFRPRLLVSCFNLALTLE